MELWTFLFFHAINQWNNTSRFYLAYLTPDEKFNGLKRQNRPVDHFKTFHSFGCPVYVLNEKQQSSKGEPKWIPGSRVGVYLGKSREYANSVPYILNLATDNVSPQYQCL